MLNRLLKTFGFFMGRKNLFAFLSTSSVSAENSTALHDQISQSGLQENVLFYEKENKDFDQIKQKLEFFPALAYAKTNHVFKAAITRDILVEKNSAQFESGADICPLLKKTWLSDWQTGKSALCKYLPKKYISGKRQFVKMSDGTEIETVFHDRKSSTLIVVSPGFNSFYKQLSPFLWMFNNEDVLFFNHRGHYNPSEAPKAGLYGNFLKKLFNLNFSPQETKLGQTEDSDLAEIVNFYKNAKNYTEVICVGFCFGAAMAVKAQAKNPGLFTKLILDSVWNDFKKITDKFISNLFLIKEVQGGKQPSILKALYGLISCRPLNRFLVEKILFQAKLPSYDLTGDIASIEVPILYIHSKKDNVVDFSEFWVNWQNTKSKQKFAFINNQKHLMSFLNERFVYKALVKQFQDSKSFDLSDFEASEAQINNQPVQAQP